MFYQDLDRSQMTSLIMSSRLIYWQGVVLANLGLPPFITNHLEEIYLALRRGVASSNWFQVLCESKDEIIDDLYQDIPPISDRPREHIWAEKQLEPATPMVICLSIHILKAAALDLSSLGTEMYQIVSDIANMILLIGWWISRITELIEETVPM